MREEEKRSDDIEEKKNQGFSGLLFWQPCCPATSVQLV